MSQAIKKEVLDQRVAELVLALTEELQKLEKAERWPFKHYASQGDELNESDVAKLFECETAEQVMDWQNDIEESLLYHCMDYEYDSEKDWIKEELKPLLTDEEEDDIAFFVDDVHEGLREDGMLWWDYSDILNTCMRNSTVHICAYPLNEEGSNFEAPMWEQDEDYQKELSDNLKETFGCTDEDIEKIEPMYCDQVLCLNGTVDVEDWVKFVMKNDKIPDTVCLSNVDSDNTLFHSSWNGSGSYNGVVIRKDVEIKAEFVYDNTRKYGVDAVYGFCGSYWSHEIEFK